MKLDLSVDGPISETNSLFSASVANATVVNIDLNAMTFINSIGVKNWITFMGRIPAKATVHLHNCPLVMINQVSMVVGFLPTNGFVESFKMPYHCDDCGAEDNVTGVRGKDFEYASSNNGTAKIEIPEEKVCPKCRKTMTLDFNIVKTMAFLNPR